MERSTNVEWRLLAAAGALGALGCVANAIGFDHHFLPVDDAYITLQNAVSFWTPDTAYPDAPALRGATSGWHTLLIALAALVLPPLGASWVVGSLAVVAYAVGLVLLLRNLETEPPLALALTAVGLLAGDVPHHLFNGLETGLGLAAVTWILAVWTLPSSPRRDVALAVICGQLPWVRPELAAVSGLVAVGELWGREDRVQAALKFGGIAVASAAPWAIAYMVAIGSPLSSTGAAKATWFAEYCLPFETRLERSATNLLAFGAKIGAVGVGLLFWYRSGPGRVAAVFLPLFLIGFVVSAPGAMMHYAYRYLYVSIPFLVVGVSSVLAMLPRGASWTVLVVIGLQLVVTVPSALDHHERARRFTETQLGPAAATLQRLPPDAIVLVHDAGYLGFAGGRRLVDVVGLKSPESVLVHEEITAPSCGKQRGKAIVEIARRSGSTHAVVLETWNRRYQIMQALRDAGWTVSQVSPSDRRYTVLALEPPRS